MKGGALNSTAAINASTKYYVSPLGNDSADGMSVLTAWRTLARVNLHILLPGDQVLLEGGKFFTGYLNIHNSGVSGQNIRVASYGAGKATINSGAGIGIYVYNNSFIVVDSLNVSGGWNAATQAGNESYGILFYTDLPGAVKLGDVTVSNCEVTGYKLAGISVLSYPDDLSQSGYSRVYVRSNSVHANGDEGISTLGRTAPAGHTLYAFPYINISNNKVYDNLGVKANTSSHSGDGIVIADASGGVVQNNVAYNNGWNNMAAGGGPAGIWCYDSKNITFQYNESHHNGTGNGKPDGDGFDLDGGTVNCIMQYNYSHDNHAAGFLVWEYGNSRIKNANNIIRYNISQNDNTGNNTNTYAGVSIGPSCNNILVNNNSIYTVKGSSIFVTGGTNLKFYNNIFYGTQGSNYFINSTTANCRFVSNDYFNQAVFRIRYAGVTYSALSSFRTTGNERLNNVDWGTVANPALLAPGSGGTIGTGNPFTMNNYTLNAGSPMINAGFNLTTLGFNPGTQDFKKASIPFNGGYDIGACEKH